MGKDTTTINHEVNAATYRRFKQVLKEKYGSTHGRVAESLEEALELYVQIHEEDNPRIFESGTPQVLAKLGRIEDRLDSLETLERERHTSNAQSVGTETENKLKRMVANLPEDTTLTESMVESVIEDEGLSSFKTLKKYTRLMRRRGHLLPHPCEDGKYVTSPKTFAVICENNEEVTPKRIDYWLGELEEILGTDWYVEALPNGYFSGSNETWRTLKYAEAVRDGEAHLEARARELGAIERAEDERKGFQ